MAAILTQIFAYVDSTNGTAVDTSVSVQCLGEIKHTTFFQWLMLPAMLEIAILSFSIRRNSLKWRDKCWARPAIAIPMDIFDKSDRYSYMAAFGSVAYLSGEVVLNSKYVIEYQGPVAYRVFVILLSVICYGIAYFPIFAALALLSIPSLILGSLHVWMFTGIEMYKSFVCVHELEVKYTLLSLLRDLPKLVALGFLSVSIPIRLIRILRKKLEKMESSTNKTKGYTEQLEEIRKSRIGVHVAKNFVPPKPKLRKPREGIKGKIKDIALPILRNWIYFRNPEFKYSPRLLSSIVICFMLIYKLTLEIVYLTVELTNAGLENLLNTLSVIGFETYPGEDPNITRARELIYIVYYFLDAFKICVITATVIECLLSCLNLLHVLSSYRKYLLALHKGINYHIPPRSEKSNASIMVGGLRYVGYQIGFSLWAYLIQLTLISLVFCVIAFIITLYRVNEGGYITYLIRTFWSLPVAALAINILQILISKFLFLQEKGEYLAIENRRGFFVFAYFMFFYNIFIGLIGCLLRMIKAIIIGTLFLGRLDHSTLPRRFQLFDPGFDAYVGFLHLENAQLHPVILTFVAILNIKCPARLRPVLPDEEKEIGRKSLDESKKCMIKTRWHLAYMLHVNPDLRPLRKKNLADTHKRLEIEASKRKEEKLAKKNKTGDNSVVPKIQAEKIV